MEKNGVWGDQLETNALASTLKFNMIVHRVDTPSMAQIFHEPVGKYPTLHLSYHLNEHYNSVRRIDDPCIKGVCPLEEYEIGHDLEKLKKRLGPKYGGSEEERKEELKENILEAKIIKQALGKTGKDNSNVMKKVLCELI